MVSATHYQAYAAPASGPPGGPRWSGVPFWHPAGLSRPVGLAMMILGFVFFWPIGLAMLFLMKWSGHMGCWGRRQRAMMRNEPDQTSPWQGGWTGWQAWCAPRQAHPAAPSGNRAFDEYRTETLRRLEEEQQDFRGFLDRLRFAKDKAEFDQFMAERRATRPGPAVAPDEYRPQG